MLKYLKSAIFLSVFSFKVNEKKKVPLKNMVGREGVKRMFLLEVDI